MSRHFIFLASCTTSSGVAIRFFIAPFFTQRRLAPRSPEVKLLRQPLVFSRDGTQTTRVVGSHYWVVSR